MPNQPEGKDAGKLASSRLRLMEGQIFAGRYLIKERISRGSISAVYKAEKLPDGRLVALKVLLPKLVVDERAACLLRHENAANARLTEATPEDEKDGAPAAVQHPALVCILDSGFDEPSKLPFIVMEYVDGLTLAAKLEKSVRLEERQALNITAKIAMALAHAHARGIIHGDLNPGNIILLPTGADDCQLKVIDFGIAHIENKDDAKGDLPEVFGSPHYMSPEQCLGQKLDGRSDVYSLGCLLYHMVTGFMPYGNNPLSPPLSPQAIIMKQLANKLPDWRGMQLSEAVITILKGCLQKRPESRYPSMAALLEELNRLSPQLALQQEAFLPHASGGSDKARQGSAFNTKVARLAFSLLIILLLVYLLSQLSQLSPLGQLSQTGPR
ncbi:MAG: serine/threonine-protein kinase [Candidatus Obscuribacter sp.]|nr:serine/threonine-protein kinase [Candidatus Obscuribacter sp.]